MRYFLVIPLLLLFAASFAQIPYNTFAEVKTPNPWDGRDSLTTLADTAAYGSSIKHPGLMAYAYDVNELWMWNGTKWVFLFDENGAANQNIAQDTSVQLTYLPSHNYTDGTLYAIKADLTRASAEFADSIHTAFIVGAPDTDSVQIQYAGRYTETGHGFAVGKLYYLTDDTANQFDTIPGSFTDPVFIVLDANTLELLNQGTDVNSNIIRRVIPSPFITAYGGDPFAPTDSVIQALIEGVYAPTGRAAPGTIFLTQNTGASKNIAHVSSASNPSTPANVWYWTGELVTRVNYTKQSISLSDTAYGTLYTLQLDTVQLIDGVPTDSTVADWLETNYTDNNLRIPNGTLLYWTGSGTKRSPDYIWEVVDDLTPEAVGTDQWDNIIKRILSPSGIEQFAAAAGAVNILIGPSGVMQPCSTSTEFIFRGYVLDNQITETTDVSGFVTVDGGAPYYFLAEQGYMYYEASVEKTLAESGDLIVSSYTNGDKSVAVDYLLNLIQPICPDSIDAADGNGIYDGSGALPGTSVDVENTSGLRILDPNYSNNYTQFFNDVDNPLTDPFGQEFYGGITINDDEVAGTQLFIGSTEDGPYVLGSSNLVTGAPASVVMENDSITIGILQGIATVNDASVNKSGLELANFGETPSTGAGGDYTYLKTRDNALTPVGAVADMISDSLSGFSIGSSDTLYAYKQAFGYSNDSSVVVTVNNGSFLNSIENTRQVFVNQLLTTAYHVNDTATIVFDNITLESGDSVHVYFLSGNATVFNSQDALTTLISPVLGRTKTLLVLFGQSNAEGQGLNSSADSEDIDANSLFQIWGNETPSFSPLDISSGNNQSNDDTKHGVELGLAKYVSNYLPDTDTTYLVKHAVGGTYASTWFPNGTNGDSIRIYLKDAINYIQDAGYSPSVIMLYSQGETESTNNDSTAIFEERLGELIRAWRDTLKSNVSFIIPGIYEGNVNDMAINDAIFHIADTSRNVYYIPTKGYTSDDALHWNYQGLKNIARDFCNVIDRKMGWQGSIVRNLAPNVFEEITESANIVFNWKTEDFSKFTISGDSISNWADSLSTNLVSTGTNRPILAGADSSVVFSGGQFMFANQLFPRLYTDSAFTFFAVVDIDTTLDQTIFCQSNGSSERFAIGIKSGELCAGNFDGAWSSVATSSWSKDTKYVLAFRNSPTGTDKLFLNETQVSGGTQLPNTMISGFFRVGATTSGSFYQGKIYQILLLDEALSDAALADQIASLMTNHNIP